MGEYLVLISNVLLGIREEKLFKQLTSKHVLFLEKLQELLQIESGLVGSLSNCALFILKSYSVQFISF